MGDSPYHVVTTSIYADVLFSLSLSLFSHYGIAKCFGCRNFFIINHSRKWHVPTNLAAITFHILKNELNASLVVVLFVCLINLFIFRFDFISLDSKKIIVRQHGTMRAKTKINRRIQTIWSRFKP